MPLLSAANTFTGNQVVAGNLNATGNLTANGSINGSSEVLTGSSSILLRVNQNSTSANTFGIDSLNTSPSGIGVYGQANDSNGIGVEGLNNSPTGGVGVFGGVNNTSGVGVGVWGKTGSSSGSSIGVEADAFSATGIGLYATNSAGGYAAKFSGAVQVTGDFSGTGTVTGTTVNAGNSFSLGGALFGFGNATSLNVFLGFAGNPSSTGFSNTAVGGNAVMNMTSGQFNTAVGIDALWLDTTGSYNTATGGAALINNISGQYSTATGAMALYSQTSGNYNVGVGAFSGADVGLPLTGSSNTFLGSYAQTSNGAFNNATAIGANAMVSENNALVLGSINGVNNATADTNVGIGTTTPTYRLHLGVSNNSFRVEGPATAGTNSPAASFGGFGDFGIDAPGISQGRFVIKESGFVGIGVAAPTHILQVGQGKGIAFADGWTTYSSRRWKTNIRTLPDALAKVEQLRGVTYDLKGSGKHEIGVIAEEVGQVVPEVVSFEDNGKDAQGVEYSRLTAVLIEAVKEQQGQIRRGQTTAKEQEGELQQERAQLAKALRLITQQQSLLQAQASALRSLKNEVRETRETLRKLNVQVNASQPGLLAAK